MDVLQWKASVSRIYFSWIIFVFVLQEPAVYAQYLVFSSIPWCEESDKSTTQSREHFYVILNLTCLYGTVEKGAVIPSQSPFPFPIASFSLVVPSLLGGLGNLTVGGCYEHSYHLQNVILKEWNK